MKKIDLISISLTILSFLTGLYFYPRLPGKIATHWNMAGQADGYSSKTIGLFLLPIILTITFLLLKFLPKADPYRENVKSFKKDYEKFILLIEIFLFYLYILSIIWNLGTRFNFGQMLAPAFALLWYFAGDLIGKAKRNWFIGIRTPWTLSSDEVWNKTHKRGEQVFKTASGLALFGFLLPSLTLWLVILPVLTGTIYLFTYSYLLYKKKR